MKSIKVVFAVTVMMLGSTHAMAGSNDVDGMLAMKLLNQQMLLNQQQQAQTAQANSAYDQLRAAAEINQLQVNSRQQNRPVTYSNRSPEQLYVDPRYIESLHPQIYQQSKDRANEPQRERFITGAKRSAPVFVDPPIQQPDNQQVEPDSEVTTEAVVQPINYRQPGRRQSFTQYRQSDLQPLERYVAPSYQSVSYR